MKFLHLADLHLGKRVNGFDMLEDQRFILEQILTLCEKHGVEAVVIAGDIYDTPVPPAAACTLLDWFLTQLAARRIPVLAVSGNHDSAERLDFASSLLAEQNVHIAGRFTGCPKQVVLNDRHGPIEFTLLPFVRAATVRHYLPDADITDYDSAVGAALAVCEPAAPRRVLVAHQMVVSGVCPPQLSGSETAPLTVGTVDSIDAARFAGFCYAALGHIHRAQRVGIDAVRYAGAPLCYHLDECGMQKSVTLVRVGKRGVEKIDGMMIDLGVSSHQLDTAERGFSYHADAPLDMRMDQDQPLTAREIVNTWSAAEITRILRDYSEEKWAARIAQIICEHRAQKPLETTGDLVACVDAAIPKKVRMQDNGHSARRTFQALRIAVNDELDPLKKALEDMVELLNPGGHLAVLTFHSLEDRIVKQTFRRLANPCTCPPKIPVCICGKKPVVRVLGGGGIKPDAQEVERNPRARSAMLRGCEKLETQG